MKKIGYFFFCFLPLIASVSLQFLVTFPAMGLSAMQVFISNIASGKKEGFEELFTTLSSVWSGETFTSVISVLFAASGVIIFGFWYCAQFHGSLRQSPRTFASPMILLGIICMVPALQMLSSVLTGIVASLFPGWMDFYQKLMETAGFHDNPSFLLILYAVILGPIEEELTFRGVTLSSARRILPFWAANIFQALLFGVFHMNMIQGIYAFFIGLFLGYVCEKGGSVYLSVFLHILFNAWGTFMPADSPLLQSPLYSGIFFAVSVFLGIVGLYLFQKYTLRQKAKDSCDSSDI